MLVGSANVFPSASSSCSKVTVLPLRGLVFSIDSVVSPDHQTVCDQSPACPVAGSCGLLS